jgi:integrase
LIRPWAAVQKAAGLSGYCPHDLRRTHASFILSSGYDLATVGRQLGHTQAKTTARYAFLSDSRRRDGMQSAVTSMVGQVVADG